MSSSQAFNRAGLNLLDAVDLHRMLGQRVKDAGSQSELARKTGVSVQFLHSVLNGVKDPSPAILDMLGVRRVTRYEIKGSQS